MKPFHTVAIPHKDILEGRFAMDIFAADLWETYHNRAPKEYTDPVLFFERTYLTDGLKNLLDVVKRRLEGRGGDHMIQIQTPFGGGKTHALISLYHKASEWGVKRVVFVGTALDPDKETPWGLLERQLTGNNMKLTGRVSPGRDALRELLLNNQPVLILMDEILEYTTKAAGITVGDTTLAAQVLAFMQELTEVAGTLEKVCVVVTLPSSLLEHYDEMSERLFQQLQKISGRVEKIYTPVRDEEISKVVRQRLFSYIDESAVESIVTQVSEYMEREGMLPVSIDVQTYRKRFLDSYPFIPDVIDVLYHRWGSLPTFQRTRGVLRLLALVIGSLKGSSRPYITLSDFDLSNEEIRRELIKHIGPEFDSIVSADITDINSGSKLVDNSIGVAYRGLNIGTRVSTSIFLYSFSAKEKGTSLIEIKRNASVYPFPSSIIVEALEQLKNKLLYLQTQNGKYYFLNQPNLNMVFLTKMENIKDNEVDEEERKIIEDQISNKIFKVYIWPDKPKDIPDTQDLKLVILREKDESYMSNILEYKGETPRVYRNTVLFLCPLTVEKNNLRNSIKRKIAYEQIKNDTTLNLTDEQRDEVNNNIQEQKRLFKDMLKQCYRIVYVPVKDGLKDIDLGMPTYGDTSRLDEWVYNILKDEEEILEKVHLIISQKYLSDKEYIKTKDVYEAMLKTPGEIRIRSLDSFKDSIREGVRQGLFGIGNIKEDKGEALETKVECRYFKTDYVDVTFSDDEVIIKDTIAQRLISEPKPYIAETKNVKQVTTDVKQTQEVKTEEKLTEVTKTNIKDHICLEFIIPRGKVADVLRMINFLQTKFDEVKITIDATKGSISEEEYINKIKEALNQLNIEIIKE